MAGDISVPLSMDQAKDMVMKPKALPPGSPQGEAPGPEQNQSNMQNWGKCVQYKLHPPFEGLRGFQRSVTNLLPVEAVLHTVL